MGGNKKKKKKKKWDGHITRMDAEKLVKISSDSIPAGRSPVTSEKKME